MKIRIRSVFVLVLIAFRLFGQDRLVEGVITDSLTEQPLQFVHVSVSDEIGTISNYEGRFSLKWDSNTTAINKIRFTSIGYNSYESVINSDTLNSDLIIHLVPSLTILDGITITSEEKVDSAIFIMQKVLKNIRKNYPSKKYGMEAFYREANISDDEYSRLIEAQIYIADKGYKKPIETVEMNVLQMRKTEDNRNISWRESLFEWLYLTNGGFKTLANDRVRFSTHAYNSTELTENIAGLIAYEKRNHEGSIRFLSNEFIESCDWELEKILKVENDTTYVLKYEVINKNKRRSFARIGKGVIYVSKADWGVKEIRSKVVKPDGTRYNQLDYTLKGSRAYYKTIIKYKKQSGKYYLFYIKSESIGTNSRSLFGGRDRGLFEETKGRLGKIYQENELFVTRILPYEKISKNNRMDKEDDLYNVHVKNNEVFWAAYNYPLLNPLTDKMKTDLKNSYGQLFIKD